ncbi:hypothetical protein [Desulfonatronum parangueonense]
MNESWLIQTCGTQNQGKLTPPSLIEAAGELAQLAGLDAVFAEARRHFGNTSIALAGMSHISAVKRKWI